MKRFCLFCLCLLVVILIVLQVFVVTSFKIPSDSMEPSLLAGDCILVDKCSGGARLFNVLDAVEKKEVKIQRMSGWRNYQRNDVLVFNFPYPGRWDSIALDVMLYYVKRCIAMPGDTLEIRNTHYRVSGFDGIAGNVQAQEELDELISSGMTEERGLVLKSFPDGGCNGWTISEFGPLYIPAKGSVVGMNPETRLLYRNVIEWEQKKKLTLHGDSVLLGDSVIHNYRFCENYYFVSGDKMVNSKDSRYWGLLPEPFIVGRAWLVWNAEFKREKIGDMPTEMFFHFFKSFSDAARMNLNIKAEGDNEHHKIEGIFKALARALKMAIRRDIFHYELPSTKGAIF